jgi:hypothetical protein
MYGSAYSRLYGTPGDVITYQVTVSLLLSEIEVSFSSACIFGELCLTTLPNSTPPTDSTLVVASAIAYDAPTLLENVQYANVTIPAQGYVDILLKFSKNHVPIANGGSAVAKIVLINGISYNKARDLVATYNCSNFDDCI